jgi:hypothetical protein
MAMAAVFVVSAHNAKAETALEVESWCMPVANAKTISGSKISMEQTFDSGSCWGAFAAFQGLGSAVGSDGVRTLHYCAPPESSRVEFVKVFVHFVEVHPQQGHLPFTFVALKALVEAFPCADLQ